MYKFMLGLSAHTPLSSLTSYEPLINCWALQREASLARAAAFFNSSFCILSFTQPDLASPPIPGTNEVG